MQPEIGLDVGESLRANILNRNEIPREITLWDKVKGQFIGLHGSGELIDEKDIKLLEPMLSTALINLSQDVE